MELPLWDYPNDLKLHLIIIETRRLVKEAYLLIILELSLVLHKT